MLQHLRPVKVVLTPLISAYFSAVGSCAWFCSCSWERISIPPSVSGIAGGRLAGKVVCFLWAYGVAAQKPVSASDSFGSSAVRLFQLGSADSRCCSPVKGESWPSTQPGLFPSPPGDGG